MKEKAVTLPVRSDAHKAVLPSSTPSFLPNTAEGFRKIINRVEKFVLGTERSQRAEGKNVCERRERHAGGRGGAAGRGERLKGELMN